MPKNEATCVFPTDLSDEKILDCVSRWKNFPPSTFTYTSVSGANKSHRRPLRPIVDELAFDPMAKYLGVSEVIPGTVLDLTPEQMKGLLITKDPALEKSLFALSLASTNKYFGNKVYARAIVEFSNVCTKDCFYCGIRKHMKIHRYSMSMEEILSCADFAYEQGMGTLMLQSGELPTKERIEFMLDVVKAIRRRTVEMDYKKRGEDLPRSDDEVRRSFEKGLAVALSLGELPSDVYQAFFDAGAHRYLLRIETSNPELYSKLHPRSHSHAMRLKCLEELKRIGFQVGTGVMVGVPYQTVEHMVEDLLFFRSFQPDMIGLGPYVVQSETPLGRVWLAERQGRTEKELMKESEDLLNLTTRMYALARLTLGDVNIAATTALQVLDASGRELALERGANVVMPIITPKAHREQYQIYQDKPCIDEDALRCKSCLQLRVRLAGKELLLDGGWHDPPHYLSQRTTMKNSNTEINK